MKIPFNTPFIAGKELDYIAQAVGLGNIGGEGGALCINDESLVERAEIIRDKGTNRQQFLRRAVDKYTWVDVGSSYVPSEIMSAFLCDQLETLAPISVRRMTIFETYDRLLRPLASEELLRGPVICYHDLSKEDQERVIDHVQGFLQNAGHAARKQRAARKENMEA